MTAKTPRELILGADGPGVEVSGRVAEYLMRYAGLDRYWRENRGADAEVDNTLLTMAAVAARWRASATGSKEAAKPEVTPELAHDWYSTTEAGNLLGVSDRAMRLACQEKRIQAERRNGRWRIHRTAIEHFKAAKAA